jgi:uncharacterized cupredoxin-like copper-binding protein
MTGRRTLLSVVLTAVVAVVAVVAGGSVLAVTASAARSPARMLVYAQEWSLWPSRGSLPAGAVIVQMANRGQDAHDLRIRRLGRGGTMVGRAQRVAVTSSGGLGQAAWRLGPGAYELYCSMPGHRQRGMHARLIVR